MDLYSEGSAEANKTRAWWAITALEAFGEQTGQKGEEYFDGSLDMDGEALREIAGDLLGDLFHLARLNGIHPALLVASGAMHYTAEVDEELSELELEDGHGAAEEATEDFRIRGLQQIEAFLKGEAE